MVEKQKNADAERHGLLVGTIATRLLEEGNAIAQREGYREHNGIDALRYFLMRRHNWLPREVRALSLEDLDFATCEDKLRS